MFLLVGGLILTPFGYFKKAEASTGYPVPHIITGIISAANGTFLPLAHTVYVATQTTEARVQKYMTYSGTWSGLSVYVRSVNASGTTTLTVRKNGVDTAVTVTVPQNTTGLFQDLVNTVHVDPGDLMSIGITTSAGAASVTMVNTQFASDSGDSVHYNMTYDPGLASTGAQPRYYKPNGDFSGAFTSEANNRIRIQHDATLTEVSVYVTANTRTAASVFRTRIGGATGNLAASVPATSLGLYTNTSTSDTLTSGDLFGYILTWTSGANAITWVNLQTTIVSDNPREITFMSGNQVTRNAGTGDSWSFVAGLGLFSGSAEAIARSYPITPGVMSEMAFYASSNTATQVLTFQLRRNGANVNLNVPYPAQPTAGWQEDTTNSDAFDGDDYMTLNNTRAAAGSGTTIYQSTSVKYTMDEILPTYTQSAYRLFNNANSADVGSALAAQDTPATLATAGDAFRLRMLINVDTNRLDASGETFKLQYVDKGAGSCASPSGGTPASYTDVTGATLIAYNDNASPADAAALTANANDPTNGGNTIVNQTYEELNNFTNSQAAILSGQDGKWDFSLIDNGATAGETYCLRVVQSDGTVLGTYDVYPEISIPDSAQSITFSISDNTIGFGTVSPSATSYATGDTNGTGSETVAHTFEVNTNATSGYVVSILGDTLKNGLHSITSCGADCTPTPGIEQFGLRLSASGGSGIVEPPYDQATDYAYEATASTSDVVASAASGDSVTTTYSVRYVTNVAATTEAGTYSGAYTYTVTPSF